MRARTLRVGAGLAVVVTALAAAAAGAGGAPPRRATVTPEAMSRGLDGPLVVDVQRPLRASDARPLGGPATPPGLASRGWVVVDPVVDNVDGALQVGDQVDDGEPVIAVNPLHPNQVALLTGRDGGEWWGPGGCDPEPTHCPMGAGNEFGSIWLSDDGGRSWAKHYDVPAPTNIGIGVCSCDRVISWAADGTLAIAVLVYANYIYVGTTTDPFDGAWSWTLDGNGRAVPIGGRDPLPVSVGDVGANGYADQPWIVTAPDPLDPSVQNISVGYNDDETRGYDLRYSSWIATAHGTDHPLFTEHTQIWKFPICCDDRVETQPSYTPVASVATLKMAADRRSGTLWAIYGVSHGVIFTGPDPDGQAFDTITRPAAFVDQRIVRSTDGGRTWSLGGHTSGVAVDSAFSVEESAKFGRFSALFGGTHMVAANPADGSAYVVYGDYDVTTNKNRLAIRNVSVDAAGQPVIGPKHYVTDQVDAALPTMAVADDGTIGVLYDQLDGYDPDGFAVVSVHLARSHDGGASWDDTIATTFTSVEQEDPNDVRQRPLGDYQQLVAVGNTFYGVATTNGASFGRSTNDWDPVFVRAPSYDKD